MAKTTVTEEMSQSQHDKTETTIKHPKEFQILTTEMPRKKSKPKEKEMLASSSDLDKEIKKKMKEIKEEKLRLDKELKEEKMRLDKELKDIIKQWQEEKRKREEKDQEKAQAITDIMAILQDSDLKIVETKQERNQKHKDITVRDHNKKIADKLKEYQDTSDNEERHEEKRILRQPGKEKGKKTEPTVNIPKVKVIKTKEGWTPTKRDTKTRKKETTQVAPRSAETLRKLPQRKKERKGTMILGENTKILEKRTKSSRVRTKKEMERVQDWVSSSSCSGPDIVEMDGLMSSSSEDQDIMIMGPTSSSSKDEKNTQEIKIAGQFLKEIQKEGEIQQTSQPAKEDKEKTKIYETESSNSSDPEKRDQPLNPQDINLFFESIEESYSSSESD